LDEKFRPIYEPVTRSASYIAETIRDKKAFFFDLDNTLLDKDRKAEGEIIEIIMKLLKAGKFIGFATVRSLNQTDYKRARKGEGIGILREIFEHPDFEPEMANRIYFYAQASTRKYRFDVDDTGRVIINHDQKYYDHHKPKKVFLDRERGAREKIKRIIINIHRGLQDELNLPEMNIQFPNENPRIATSPITLRYYPNRQNVLTENWKLRILVSEIKKRLKNELPEEFYDQLVFRVVNKNFIVIAKEGNRKNEAISDFNYIERFNYNEIVYFADEFAGDGIDRLTTKLRNLTIVSVRSPISGDFKFLQLESEKSEEGPERIIHIFEAYFPSFQPKRRIEFTEEDVRDAVQEIKIDGQNLDMKRVSIQSLRLYLREANQLESLRPEWILRSILGKSSFEAIKDEEKRLLFYEGKVRPNTMLFRPVQVPQPGSIPRTKRLKKANQLTAGNRPVSAAFAEAAAWALFEKLKRFIGDDLRAGEKIYVLAKYSGGLVIGAVLAQQANLPLLILTKRNYPFATEDVNVIEIIEPNLGEGHPEYYSRAVVPKGAKVLYIDDEATSGMTAVNIIQGLDEKLNAEVIGIGVVSQSSPAAAEVLRKFSTTIPYQFLDQIKPKHLSEADKPKPSFIKFKEPLPIIDPATQQIPQEPIRPEDKRIPSYTYPVDDAFPDIQFMDHPYRGLTLPLPAVSAQRMGKIIQERLERELGSIGHLRQGYYRRNKTLFMVSPMTSGILAAIPASRMTRLPFAGAMNRPEPEGYAQIGASDIVSYIGLDGYANSIFGLSPGDGTILITGELLDGEEQKRIISALHQKNIDVLAVVSVMENKNYNGRESLKVLIENLYGDEDRVPIISLNDYKIEERVLTHNRTSHVWDTIKFALLKLDERIRKINPDAIVEEMKITPSSMTAGLATRGSDIDTAYIYVKGISQLELTEIQEEFNRWLEIGGFRFDDKDKAPILLSLWHSEQNEAKYETKSAPKITIYQNGKFLSPEEIVEQNTPPVIQLLDKSVARIKWLVSLGELDVEYVEKLIRIEFKDERDKWRDGQISKLSGFIDQLSESRLSKQALTLIDYLDDIYLSDKFKKGKREFQIPKDLGIYNVSKVLRELIEKEMIRVYDGKIVLVWRHGSVRWSDRFWKDLIAIVGKEDVVREMHEEWLANHPDHKAYKANPSGFIRSPWTKNTPPIAMATALIDWKQQAGPLSDRQKKRWFEAFGSRDAFAYARAVELADTREEELREFVQNSLIELIDKEMTADKVNDPKEHHEKLHSQIQFLFKVLFRWLKAKETIPEQSYIQWMFQEILRKGDRIKKLPYFMFRILSNDFGKIYGKVNSPFERSEIARYLSLQANNFRQNSRMNARRVIDKLKKQFPEVFPEAIARVGFRSFTQEIAPTTQDLERQKIFERIEERRRKGNPIENIAADWDGTLKWLRSSDPHTGKRLQFLLRWWLTKQGKGVAISTAAPFERFYREALDPNLDPAVRLPSPATLSNFHVFTDTVTYLNNNPIDYFDNRPLYRKRFSSEFTDEIEKVLEKSGWNRHRDGAPPMLTFWKQGFRRAEAEEEAQEIERLLNEFNEKAWRKANSTLNRLLNRKKKLEERGKPMPADLEAEIQEAEKEAQKKKADKDFYLTLSPFGTGGRWVIKIYYATKAAVFNETLPSGDKIDSQASLILGDDAGEMGNDRPLFEAGEGSLKVHVGEKTIEEDADTVQLQTLRYDGSLLALEALVASTLLRIQDENQPVEVLLEPLYREIQEDPDLREAAFALEPSMANIYKLLTQKSTRALPKEIEILSRGLNFELRKDLGLSVPPPKALVVDDDPVGRDAMRAILESFGFQAELAERPAEVLSSDKPKDSSFDIVFTDYKMPEMNGIDFAEAFRKSDQTYPPRPILLVTGAEPDPAFQEALEKRTISDVIKKPYDRSRVLKMIRLWLPDKMPMGLEKISEKQGKDGKIISIAYRGLSKQVHLQDVFIVFPDAKISEPICYLNAFGRVHLLAVPEAKPDSLEPKVSEIPASEIVPNLDPKILLHIFENLRDGQRFNLSTLPSVLDYRWNERSGNVYERELAFLRRMWNEAPMGNLLTDNRLFPTDQDGNLVLVHVTPGKQEILESDSKSIAVSLRALGPVVYTTPLTQEISDTPEPVTQIGHLSSLGNHVYNNLHYHRNIPPEANPDDYFMAFVVPYAGKRNINTTANWIDFFGFGPFYLETYRRLQSSEEPKLTDNEDLLIKREVLYQFEAKARPFFELALNRNYEESMKQWETYWDTFKVARGAVPILNWIFFEVFKEYVILYQNDTQSEELRKVGIPNLRNYYEIVFDLDPSQKDYWNFQQFMPDFDRLVGRIGQSIEGFDIDHFKRFIIERFYIYTAMKFLEGKKLPDKITSFEAFEKSMPNLAGLLHFNVTHSLFISENADRPDIRRDYKAKQLQVMREAFERSRLLVPIMGSMIPTGESGIWGMPGADLKVVDLHFSGGEVLGEARLGDELDLTISKWDFVGAGQRGLAKPTIDLTEPGIIEIEIVEEEDVEAALAKPVEADVVEEKKAADEMVKTPRASDRLPRIKGKRTLSKGEIRNILRTYYNLDIAPENMIPLTGGIASVLHGFIPYKIILDDGRTMVFKNIARKHDRALYIAGFMDHLAQKGSPVAKTHRTLSGDYIANIAGYFCVLFDFLEGLTIKPIEARKEHFISAGKAAADIHINTSDFIPRAKGRYNFLSREEVAERLREKLENFNEEIKNKLSKTHAIVSEEGIFVFENAERIEELLLRHLDHFEQNYTSERHQQDHTHGDLHFGNILFNEKAEVIGLIDPASQMDDRIVEFNNMLPSVLPFGLLGDDVDHMFKMFRVMVEAYKKRLKEQFPMHSLSAAEEKQIWEIVRLRFIEESVNSMILRIPERRLDPKALKFYVDILENPPEELRITPPEEPSEITAESLGQQSEYLTIDQIQEDINNSITDPVMTFMDLQDARNLSKADLNEKLFYILREQIEVIFYNDSDPTFSLSDLDPDLAKLKKGVTLSPGDLESAYNAVGGKNKEVVIHLSKDVDEMDKLERIANILPFRVLEGYPGTLTAALLHQLNEEGLRGVKRDERGYWILDMTEKLAELVAQYQAGIELSRAA